MVIHRKYFPMRENVFDFHPIIETIIEYKFMGIIAQQTNIF